MQVCWAMAVPGFGVGSHWRVLPRLVMIYSSLPLVHMLWLRRLSVSEPITSANISGREDSGNEALICCLSCLTSLLAP
jgi:hypothetical protein